MSDRRRPQITYGNVVGTLALFVALGGTGYAAITIGSQQIKDNSVRSRDIRNNDVRGKDIRKGTIAGSDVGRNRLGGRAVKESSLGTVPRAADAAALGGVTADQLRVRCPADTFLAGAGCVERAQRGPSSFDAALSTCAQLKRRLPAPDELAAVLKNNTDQAAFAGPEFVSDFFRLPDAGGTSTRVRVMVMTTAGGISDMEDVAPTADNPRRFRCVGPAVN